MSIRKPRYRRLRKPGSRWHGRKDGKSVSIVRNHKNGKTSFRWDYPEDIFKCAGLGELTTSGADNPKIDFILEDIGK